MENNKKVFLSTKKHLILALTCFFALFFCVACSSPARTQEKPPSEKNQSVCTAEMLNASVAYKGNIARLKANLKKAKAGEPLTVAFLGGSITVGSGAAINKSYVNLTEMWLKEQFAESDVKIINAGISGTGSLIGIHRLKKEVLDLKPDIVVLEFAVNDGVGDNDNLLNLNDGIAFESIVRDILKSNSQTAVIILNECVQNGYSSRKDKEETAKFYQVPVLDYFYAVDILISGGKNTWSDFTKDSIHPTTLGHKVTYEILTDFFQKALAAENQTANLVPETTRTGALFCGGKMLDKNADVTQLGAFSKGTEHWYFKNGFKGTAGQPLLITIKARNIGVFINKTTKNDGVEFIINVDGTEKIISTVSDKSYEQLSVEMIVFNDYKMHEVSVSVREITNSLNRNAEILGFMIS